MFSSEVSHYLGGQLSYPPNHYYNIGITKADVVVKRA
jgi:hypothetical protein